MMRAKNYETGSIF